jgi:hypothetical protein
MLQTFILVPSIAECVASIHIGLVKYLEVFQVVKFQQLTY